MKYTPSIPLLIWAWVKTERKRNAARGPDYFQSEGELRAEGERAIDAHDAEVRQAALVEGAHAVALERARIVAWMGTSAIKSTPLGMSIIKHAAQSIQDGAHNEEAFKDAHDLDVAHAVALEREEWAQFFEQFDATVGRPELTPELIARLMRGPRPFGAYQAEGGE